jgi:hypothetical protein
LSQAWLISGMLSAVLFSKIPPMLDASANSVLDGGLQPKAGVGGGNDLARRAKSLHNTLFVADMHSDTLLWGSRELLERSNIGHVDVPRLLEGNVALQIFTIVTGTPPAMNFETNDAPSLLTDMITRKAALELWGLASLTSRTARVLFQSDRLHDAAMRSGGALRVVQTRADLEDHIAGGGGSTGLESTGLRSTVAAVLGIEGAHALDGKVANVDIVFNVRFGLILIFVFMFT